MLDMTGVATVLGSIVGVIGGATGVFSSINQHKQTRIMEIGLERAFESPDGEGGKGFERKIRDVITRRLGDTRRSLEQKFEARIAPIEQELKADHITEYKHILMNLSASLRDGKTISDLAEEAKRIRGEILVAQERIQAEADRNSYDIALQGRDIGGLQQQVEVMRGGIGFHDAVLNRMRLIAEQLLLMTSQHEATWQDTMVKPNDKIAQDGVANQGEAVGQDGMIERDETAGRDSFSEYGG